MHDGERRWYNKDVSMHDVDGLNAGFASAILEQYLENPEAVPEEWRELFESGSSDVVRGPGSQGYSASPSVPKMPWAVAAYSIPRGPRASASTSGISA